MRKAAADACLQCIQANKLQQGSQACRRRQRRSTSREVSRSEEERAEGAPNCAGFGVGADVFGEGLAAVLGVGFVFLVGLVFFVGLPPLCTGAVGTGLPPLWIGAAGFGLDPLRARARAQRQDTIGACIYRAHDLSTGEPSHRRAKPVHCEVANRHGARSHLLAPEPDSQHPTWQASWAFSSTVLPRCAWRWASASSAVPQCAGRWAWVWRPGSALRDAVLLGAAVSVSAYVCAVQSNRCEQSRSPPRAQPCIHRLAMCDSVAPQRRPSAMP